jgi:hypothetical protein
MNCLLFQVANESVRVLWGQEVRYEVEVEEDSLANCDEHSEQPAWLLDVKENEQVHPLVFSLFQHMMDPPVISLQRPQASHVSSHAAHHSRHSCYRL